MSTVTANWPVTSPPTLTYPISGPAVFSRSQSARGAKRRRRLSTEQKMTILELLGTKTQETVADEFDVGPLTVAPIKKEVTKIQEEPSKFRGAKKTIRKTRIHELETMVLSFIHLARSKRLTVSGAVIRASTRKECARLLASTNQVL